MGRNVRSKLGYRIQGQSIEYPITGRVKQAGSNTENPQKTHVKKKQETYHRTDNLAL